MRNTDRHITKQYIGSVKQTKELNIGRRVRLERIFKIENLVKQYEKCKNTSKWQLQSLMCLMFIDGK